MRRGGEGKGSHVKLSFGATAEPKKGSDCAQPPLTLNPRGPRRGRLRNGTVFLLPSAPAAAAAAAHAILEFPRARAQPPAEERAREAARRRCAFVW